MMNFALKQVKQAIKDALPAIRMEEIAITTMLRGLAQLHHGEMHGLDYRSKTDELFGQKKGSFLKMMSFVFKMHGLAWRTGSKQSSRFFGR